MSVPTLVAAGWIVAAVVMAGLWAWSVRLQNAGVVDVGWTALVGGQDDLHTEARWRVNGTHYENTAASA